MIYCNVTPRRLTVDDRPTERVIYVGKPVDGPVQIARIKLVKKEQPTVLELEQR